MVPVKIQFIAAFFDSDKTKVHSCPRTLTANYLQGLVTSIVVVVVLLFFLLHTPSSVQDLTLNLIWQPINYLLVVSLVN